MFRDLYRFNRKALEGTYGQFIKHLIIWYQTKENQYDTV